MLQTQNLKTIACEHSKITRKFLSENWRTVDDAKKQIFTDAVPVG